MKSTKNHALDLLKILFLLFVVIHHSGQITSILTHAYISVEFFFIVSGFLLMRTIEVNHNLSTINYFKRRLFKLYPHYIFSFWILFLSMFLFKGNSITITHLLESLPEMLLLQNTGLFKGGINMPCWYLSVLVWASPLIYGLCKKTSRNTFNIIAVSCVITVYTYLSLNYGQLEIWDTVLCFYLPFWRGLAGIFLGTLLFQYVNKEPTNLYIHTSRHTPVFELFFLALIIVFLFMKQVPDLIAIICICILLVFAMRESSLLDRFARIPWIQKLLPYEYAIFLNHNFVTRLYHQIIQKHFSLGPGLNIILLVAFLIVYSMITQHIVDYFISDFHKRKSGHLD